MIIGNALMFIQKASRWQEMLFGGGWGVGWGVGRGRHLQRAPTAGGRWRVHSALHTLIEKMVLMRAQFGSGAAKSISRSYRESVRRGLSLAKQNSQSALPTEPQKSDQLCQAIQPGSWQGWPLTPSIQTRRGLYTASVKTFKKHLDKSHHNNPEWVKNQPKRSAESL